MPMISSPTSVMPAGAPSGVGAVMPPAASAVSGWDKFLQQVNSDPATQQALIMAGLQMMTPRGQGENQASKLLQGAQKGFGTYQELKNQEGERARREATTKLIGAQTESTEEGTKGKKIENIVADATSGTAIQSAEDLARLRGAQADAAEVTAENAPAEARLNIELTQQQIAKQKMDLDHYDEILQAKLLTKGSDRRGSDQILAEALTTAQVGSKEDNPNAWNLAFLENARVVRESKGKSAEEIKAGFVEQTGVLGMRDGDRKDRIMNSIDTMVNSLVTGDKATYSAGVITHLSPEEREFRAAAITDAMTKLGLSYDEAARRVDQNIARQKASQ